MGEPQYVFSHTADASECEQVRNRSSGHQGNRI
jgi:hypothetical protein